MTPESPKIPRFDPAAIERLRKVAGEQGDTFISEMAQLFLEEATKALGEMRAGCDRGDWKTVGRLAHSVKSSSATLGFMGLADACKALELNTHDAIASPETPALAAAVFTHFEQAVPTLKGMILIS